jgi:hypothetical protein
LEEVGVKIKQTFSLSILFAFVLSAGISSGAESITSGKSWRTVQELTATDKELMDLRTDTPRSSEIPYIPAEPYPFEPPYTAEEVGYRLMNFSHLPRWSHVYADVFGVITKSGYLTQGTTAGLINNRTGDQGITGHIGGIPGDAYAIFLFYYTFPPRDAGLQQLWVVRRTSQENPTKLDYFLYSPSLRRVRRQPPPRRDQQFPDNVPTFDDIVGRESWEYTWRFIGTDVIHETVRFPNTRPRITLANPDGSFYEKPTAEIRMMGDEYPHYRSDGGIDCFVVVAETKRDWLPNYNASKLIYWVDRHYFFPLRTEQYDREGKLKIVEVRTAARENPNLPEGEGYTNTMNVWFDTELDLISYGLHDAHMLLEWSDKEQVFFTPDFMRRRWLTYPQKSQARMDDADEFFLRPDLFVDRFPNERSIEISPEIAARIEAMNAAGHLVFGSAE